MDLARGLSDEAQLLDRPSAAGRADRGALAGGRRPDAGDGQGAGEVADGEVALTEEIPHGSNLPLSPVARPWRRGT